MGRVCWEGERILALSMETGSGISTHSLMSIHAHMQRTDTSTHHTSSIFKATEYDYSNKKLQPLYVVRGRQRDQYFVSRLK